MKAKILIFLIVSSFLIWAAWLKKSPAPAQAEEIPEKYHETIRKGLEYLAKCQAKDGHWDGDGGNNPVAMTGLAGLALFTSRKAAYLANIDKAADWLMVHCKPERDGLIFSGHASETDRYMQGHGLATLFLAGACRYEIDDKRRQVLTEVLTKAVRYIIKAQSSQGGWYRTSKIEGHDFDAVLETVIQVQALQAADNVGISVPHGVVEDAKEYLRKRVEKIVDGTNPDKLRGAFETAAAHACLNRTGFRFSNEKFLSIPWVKYCEREIPVGREIQFGRDELTHFYYAQALNYVGVDAWKVYRTDTFDHLQNRQNKDGSWPAGKGISAGPVYATALWCTVLQLDAQTYPAIPPPPNRL